MDEKSYSPPPILISQSFNSMQKTKKIEDIKDFIGWLWTLKVKVGHSVRTIKDIEKITKSDLKEFTSYLSYRIIFCKKDKIVKLE